MRCQICNRETNNLSKNKYTGKYESICNKCKSLINKFKYPTTIEVKEKDGKDSETTYTVS